MFRREGIDLWGIESSIASLTPMRNSLIYQWMRVCGPNITLPKFLSPSVSRSGRFSPGMTDVVGRQFSKNGRRGLLEDVMDLTGRPSSVAGHSEVP